MTILIEYGPFRISHLWVERNDTFSAQGESRGLVGAWRDIVVAEKVGAQGRLGSRGYMRRGRSAAIVYARVYTPSIAWTKRRMLANQPTRKSHVSARRALQLCCQWGRGQWHYEINVTV